MKKLTLIIAVLTLVTMLSQCRKPHFTVVSESYTQEITFNNDVGGEKGNLVTSDGKLMYDWDKDNDCLYVYCLDSDKNGLGYGGKLKIVPENINGYKASFWGRVKILKNSKYFRFYHFGREVAVDEDSHTATSDLSVQNGSLTDGKNSNISTKVVAYADFEINNECEYTGNLKLLFSVMRLDFTNFKEGIVNVSGMKGTRLNIAGNGELTLDFASAETISLEGAPSASASYYVAIPFGIGNGSKSSPDTKIKFFNDVRETYICINGTSAHYYTGADGAAYKFEYFYPKGALPGMFSVSPGNKIFFSQGNLQWTADGSHEVVTTTGATGGCDRGTWRLAEHQWDFAGEDNKNIYGEFPYSSAPVSGYYMDLFGFGTSGFSQLPYAYGPTSVSYATGETEISGTNYDWGYYNSISNGGNTPKRWRALKYSEWYYLLKDRNDNFAYNSAGKFMAGVGTLILSDGTTTVNGLFILPDDYYGKTGCKDFTVDREWIMTEKELEDYNVVFSPYGGYRAAQKENENIYINVFIDSNDGYFHTTTGSISSDNKHNITYVSYVYGGENVIGYAVDWERRYYGFFVRLVRDTSLEADENYN